MCLTWLLMDGLVDFPVCPLPYQTLYLPCWWGVREIREFDHFAVLVKDGQHCPTLCYTSARSGKVCSYSWVMVLLITLSWLLAMQSWYCVLLFYINLTDQNTIICNYFGLILIVERLHDHQLIKKEMIETNSFVIYNLILI